MERGLGVREIATPHVMSLGFGKVILWGKASASAFSMFFSLLLQCMDSMVAYTSESIS